WSILRLSDWPSAGCSRSTSVPMPSIRRAGCGNSKVSRSPTSVIVCSWRSPQENDMPDLGIGEALAAFGGSDLLAGLFGGGEAAAAGATAEAGTDLAGIVGSGEGLFGGATGLEGTLLGARAASAEYR